MTVTKQDYFSKLVDVQFDLDALERIWSSVAPADLQKEKIEQDFYTRYWANITFGEDPATDKNLAKLEEFHEKVNALVTDLKHRNYRFMPNLPAPTSPEMADLEYDLLKANADRIRHYLGNTQSHYQVRFLEKGDRSAFKAFNEAGIKHVHEILGKRPDTKPLSERYIALGENNPADPAELEALRADVDQMINSLKTLRVEAEYSLENVYIQTAAPSPS